MIWSRSLATLTAALTFVMLLLGNVVWGTGSSLACPDWPTCHGSWFPAMQGGVLFEHSHRLLGALIGTCTIATAWMLRRERQPRALVGAGCVAIALVCLQGVLGGLTVLYRLPPLVSIAHLATGIAFFSLLVFVAYASGQARVPRLSAAPGIALGALAATYAQIVLGGVVRHAGAAAACPDLPLCNGSFLPSLEQWPMLLHMLHRYLALGVALAIVVAAGRALRFAPGLASAAIVLVLAQLAIGAGVVLHRLELVTVTAHLGVAALLVANLLVLALRRDASTTAAGLCATDRNVTVESPLAR